MPSQTHYSDSATRRGTVSATRHRLNTEQSAVIITRTAATHYHLLTETVATPGREDSQVISNSGVVGKYKCWRGGKLQFSDSCNLPTEAGAQNYNFAPESPQHVFSPIVPFWTKIFRQDEIFRQFSTRAGEACMSRKRKPGLGLVSM